MQVSVKLEILTYFGKLIEQADFDGNSNAHAMLVGLKTDIEATTPDDVFTLRDSFMDGSEQKARADAALPTPPIPDLVVPTEEAAVAADPELVAVEGSGAPEPAVPAETAGVENLGAVGDAAGIVAQPTDGGDTTPPNVTPGLQSDAHEKAQDDKIASLEEQLAKAKPQ